jgi:hypothetical protein
MYHRIDSECICMYDIVCILGIYNDDCMYIPIHRSYLCVYRYVYVYIDKNHSVENKNICTKDYIIYI